MKLIYFILLFALPCQIFSQFCDLPLNEEGEFEWMQIVNIEEGAQSDLYEQAIHVVVEMFDYPDEVIRLRDKETHLLVLEFPIYVEVKKFKTHLFNLKVKMEFRDQRYKITAHHLNHFYTVGIPGFDQVDCACNARLSQDQCDCRGCFLTRQHWSDAKCAAIDQFENLLIQFQKNMKNQDNDW